MQFRTAHVLLELFYATVVLADPDFKIQHFMTEPTLRTPKVTVLNRTHDRSLLQPGYVFLDSLFTNPPQVGGGTGPMIFDMDGHLIWSGASLVAQDAYRTQHTHICDYLGQVGTHLCTTETYFHNISRPAGSPTVDQYGVHRIFDQRYEQVGANMSKASPGFQTPQRPDQHEFVTVDQGRGYLQVIYQEKIMNLTSIGGQPDHQVEQGCMQEVDFVTGETIFQWCGLDYLEFLDSPQAKARWVLEPGPNAQPWDWMHLNSADKNEEGDYLLSIRYFNQIIKIAGPNAKEVHGIEPGKILWRLGGLTGDIQTPDAVQFAFQHDARFYNTSRSETIITVFDNLKDQKEPMCSGKMIKVNNDTMQAELLQEFRHPENISCDSMGSIRTMPNGNTFVGWGNQALYSEFSAAGELLYHATFAAPGASRLKIYNYRSLKHPWVSKPSWKPKLLAYSRSCSRRNSPLVVYASWNGATEVAMWRFWVSLLGENGPWINAGVYAKTDFETRAILLPELPFQPTRQPKHVYAEALDKNRNVLDFISSGLFVPNLKKSDSVATCDEYGCFSSEGYAYTSEENFGESCEEIVIWPFAIFVLALLGGTVIGALFILRLIRHLHRPIAANREGERRRYEEYQKEPLLSRSM